MEEPLVDEPSRDDPDDLPRVQATYCATLVDEWCSAGLTDAVVSPGSRSTPMALALASAPNMRVHVHHDERSAAFMALGLARVRGRAVAALCTSGTAAVQFHAAVVEAHQSFVPLLVLTADRPLGSLERGAPQTIDQRDLFGSATRWYAEPGVPAAGGAPWWRDLARDAWTRAHGERPGPVHLNLAFDEPLVGEAGELPPAGEPLPEVPTGALWGLTDEDVARLVVVCAGRRGVVVAGARAAPTPDAARRVHALASALGWPVLADAPSGCRVRDPGCVTTFDPLLRHGPFADHHRPEVVLRLGAAPASKALQRWLASAGAVQVAVDPFGVPSDPDGVVERHWPADVSTVCDQLLAVGPDPAPAEWRSGWVGAESVARRAIDRVLAMHPEATEPAVAIDVAELLSDGGVLVASSSMPVRDLEWYAPARDRLAVVANRGANGIDGVVSTAVGAALSGAPTALLIGDVAFLHDTNGLLGLAGRPVNLVIVVIDNRGGGIFSFLPQRALLDEATFELLFGTPHEVDLVALAHAHGVPAAGVSTRAGVQAAVAGALTRGGPRVVVVTTDRHTNVALHDELDREVARAWDAERPDR